MSDTGRKIFIAMDSNTHSEEAFQWYVKHFHNDSNYVILAHAAEHGGLVTSPAPFTACQLCREEDEISRFVNQLDRKLRDFGVKGCAIRISDITPGKAIMKASKELNADLIIVGNHRHGALRRFFRGSVNKYVLKHSHIPVVSVY